MKTIKRTNPLYQTGFVMVVMLLFMAAGSIGSSNAIFPWISVCTLLLFFALFNAILGFSDVLPKYYWIKSVACYIFIAIVGGYIAYYISDISIDDAGSTRWLYMVFSFGYLVFISIIQMVKFASKLAQNK